MIKTAFKLTILMLLELSSMTLASDMNKYNVCTITINSNDEKTIFQKHLKESNFNFQELVPEGSDDENGSENTSWFDKACQTQVQCDVLVISGHFAGNFFGSSGRSLPLSDLEKHSCRQDCDGILKRPKEVFLFGCNTLADKDKDTRTPEEYYRVLVDDGIPATVAARVVEGRYGAFGQSNKARMQSVFVGAPHVYGFSSIGPSGANVKGLLDKYFQSVPDYAKHLKAVEAQISDAKQLKSQGLIPQERKNVKLADALKSTTFDQCSALVLDPKYGMIRKNICQIHNEQIPVSKRLQLIGELMKTADVLVYMPSIAVFLDENSPQKFDAQEKYYFEQLTQIKAAKEIVLTALMATKTDIMKLDTANFAFKLGWIALAEFNNIRVPIIKRLLKVPVAHEAVDAICRDDGAGSNLPIARSDLDPKIFEDRDGLEALGCLKNPSTDIVLGITDSLLSSDILIRINAEYGLKKIHPTNPVVILKLLKQMYGFSEMAGHETTSVVEKLGDVPQVRQSLIDVLVQAPSVERAFDYAFLIGQLENGRSEIVTPLISKLEDPASDVKIRALLGLQELKLATPALRRSIIKNLSEKKPELYAASLEALGNLYDKNPDDELKQIILTALASTSPKVQEAALRASASIVFQDHAVNLKIVLFLKNGDSSLSEKAAQALSRNAKDDAAVISPLISTLSNSDSRTRMWAVAALGSYFADSPDVVKAVLNIINSDQDAYVREQACDALGNSKLKDAAVRAALMKTLTSDKNSSTRGSASTALVNGGFTDPAVVMAITSQLTAESNEEQRRFEEALRTLNPTDTQIRLKIKKARPYFQFREENQ